MIARLESDNLGSLCDRRLDDREHVLCLLRAAAAANESVPHLIDRELARVRTEQRERDLMRAQRRAGL